MNNLRITDNTLTLVDQVEDKLLSYLKEKNLKIGDPIPNEMELASALGVARSVLRESLSRLKMIGMIESRTRRGMILKEPSLFGSLKRIINPLILSEETLYNILGVRIALEVGISNELLINITDEDIHELENILKMEVAFDNNGYTPASEYDFHTKLYEITKNKTVLEFQEIIHPIMAFLKNKFKDDLEPINIKLKQENKLITHTDLLEYLKKRDKEGYCKAIDQHFEVYRIFIRNRNK